MTVFNLRTKQEHFRVVPAEEADAGLSDLDSSGLKKLTPDEAALPDEADLGLEES